jgi:hypothetical protein
VVLPSAHVVIAEPLVVLLAQPPVPVAIGSWYPTVSVAPVTELVTCSLITWPADTVPAAGAPDALDWQPVRLPVNPYENGWLVAPRPGEKLAVPCS